MNRLWTLGAIDLQSAESRGMDSVLVQPKRVALLAYLALAVPHGFHRRDSLIALFWPELDADRARNALSKAVHYLRRALGPAAFRTRGDEELGLDPAHLWCDALEFERLLAAGSLEAALDLYRGHLLEGFFISGAGEFEQWLERERQRLQGRAVWAAGEVADHAGALDPASMVRWARRAAELAPGSEGELRRLLTALERAGDRAGAVQAFEHAARQLHDDYGLEPSRETLALVERIRTHGHDGPLGVGPSDRPPPARIEASSERGANPLPEVALPPRSRHRGGMVALIGLTLPILLAAVWALWQPSRIRGHELPHSRLVVLPFRTSGADPSLAFLGEGMVDLLTAKLNGAGGALAVDPRAVLSAWHREVGDTSDAGSEAVALRVVAHLGAGYAVSGGVIGDARHLVLGASLLGAPSGRQLAVASVDGPLDSLLALVDHLVAELLSRQAGEDEQRLAALTSVSLPAVRAYLDGQAAYRQGRYASAIVSYDQAVREDSTFALAALGLVWAASVAPDADTYSRAKWLAWVNRNRLSPIDQEVLRAFTGPRFPQRSFTRYRINAFDSATGAAPDRADLWFMFGDALYHDGPAIDARTPYLRAATAFHRALGLDPNYEAPLEHLVDLAATAGDSDGVRTLGAQYLRLHPESDKADYVRWRIAIALGDSSTLRSIRGRFGSMGLESLEKIVGVAQLDGVGLDDADRAMVELRTRGGRETQMGNGWTGLERLRIALALNRGRLREARTALDTLSAHGLVWFGGAAAIPMYWEPLAGDGDTAARSLESLLDAPLPELAEDRTRWFLEACAAAQWRVTHRDTAAAARAAQLLTRMAADTAVAPAYGYDQLCQTTLETYLGYARRDPGAPGLLARLDSLALVRPIGGIGMFTVNLAIARLREANGDAAAALLAVRRRPHQWIVEGLWGLSSYLREEGRLAALAGDTAEAVRADRHYLALRSHPDIDLVPEVRRVRADLARLAPNVTFPQ